MLKTDMGITLVKKHHETGDAQKLWLEFIKYMKKSTKAQIVSADINSWITTSRYDASWRGTTQSFVLYWLNRLLDYNLYCTTKTVLNDEVKLQLLQNAVKEVSFFGRYALTLSMPFQKGDRR
jgi:N-glycosylase/DNA lyase